MNTYIKLSHMKLPIFGFDGQNGQSHMVQHTMTSDCRECCKDNKAGLGERIHPRRPFRKVRRSLQNKLTFVQRTELSRESAL
jgi:rRNA maturation protein Nop10